MARYVRLRLYEAVEKSDSTSLWSISLPISPRDANGLDSTDPSRVSEEIATEGCDLRTVASGGSCRRTGGDNTGIESTECDRELEYVEESVLVV